MATKSLTVASTASSDDCVASSSSEASFCSDIADSPHTSAVTAATNSSVSSPPGGGVGTHLPNNSTLPQLVARKTSSSTASPTCSPSRATSSRYGEHRYVHSVRAPRVVRIDPLSFLAGCRTRRLNQALSVPFC